MRDNGEVRKLTGNLWVIHWKGEDLSISSEEARCLLEQKSLSVLTAKLTNEALDWAVADALGYTPRSQWVPIPPEMREGGMLWPGYSNLVVIATFVKRKKFGEFRPSSNYLVGGPLLDTYRISTEIAGDGWDALFNDCFGHKTWAKSIKGPTRLTAGLRCLVTELLGEQVDIPADLFEPEIRLAAAHAAILANA